MEPVLIALVVAALIAMLIFSRLPPALLFTLAMSACVLVGAVDIKTVLAKATNEGLVTLILLLLVSIGLERLPWLLSLSNRLVSRSLPSTLLSLSGLTMLFSAFVNNTAVVATLAGALRKNPHHPASQILLPISYAAILGGTLTLEDMANYEAIPRPVVGGPWRTLSICTATPPSSGAMQIMIPNLYDHRVPEGATQAQRIRAFVEAQRLAYADRDHYFGDPDRVAVPLEGLLNPAYLEHRAQTLGAPAEAATHGDPAAVLGGEALGSLGPDTTPELAGTTHFSIVDAEGNAVSSTMTVEGPFGSSRWAAGFVLNNEMTDFARVYAPEAPEPANAVRPGARPRSSMSPTMVFDEAGALLMVTGSPGGNSIPAYTAKTILGIQDWGLTVQEAVNFPNIIARGDAVRVETGMAPGAELAVALEVQGFNVQAREGENSGLHVIVVTETGREGAADPRREGNVLSGPTP